MIKITNKESCCGCEACVQVCPRSCITFEQDSEGFRYPLVDREACVECGLCEAVCPVIHTRGSIKPLKVYAAINRNEEIRAKSSSGGVFTLLAEETLAAGGVVCGAVFDGEWGVKHTYTDTLEGLAAMRGSKYSQSRIGTIYRDAERFLKSGRRVLFSGTPCQVAGLRRFLRCDYDNLLCVDFICHGVPSPKVWRGYLSEFVSRQVSTSYTIDSVTFRDKRSGWKRYGIEVCGYKEGDKRERFAIYTPSYKNTYMRGFLKDIYLRPSCHACPSKSLSSGSDIMVADFWGVDRHLPLFDDDKGVSMIVVNSPKGAIAYGAIDKEAIEVSPELIQRIAYTSATRHRNREKFFEALNSEHNQLSTIELIEKYNTYRWWQRIIKSIVKTKKRIFNKR